MRKAIIIVVAVSVIGLIIGVALMLNPKARQSATETPSPKATSLGVKDLVVGTGAEAVAGKNVSVNYVGTLENGTKFDSSYDRHEPFSFDLGAGRVIKGWDQGVVGMKVGGKRHLSVPAGLGYGEAGNGQIPGGATLLFDIELVSVN